MLTSVKKWLLFNWAHTQIRLVLLLTVSVFFIILAVGLTSYYTSKSVLQQELGDLQRQMLSLNMDVIDEAIKETDQAAIQVALSDNIYWFLTSENQNSYKDITEAYQLFTTIINNAAYIKSIYVYDIERDSFLAIPQGFASNSATFVDSDWTKVASEFGDKSMIVKKRELTPGAGTYGSDITLFRQIKIQGEVKGIVAINILDEALFAKLNPPVMNNLNRMRYIVDEQDQILYSVANYDFDEEAVGLALDEMKADGRGDMSFRNKQLLINQLQSPIAGWRFISIVEQDSMLAHTKHIAQVVFLVSIAALMLGGAVIYYINSKALRPVRRLKQLFGTFARKSGENDKIDLESIAGELLGKHAHLSHLVRETLSEASSKLIIDIEKGNISSRRDIQDKWQRYFPDWTEAPITVCMLSIDRYEEWARSLSGSDYSLLKFALANIATELLAEDWRIACADFGRDKMAMLMQPRGDGRQAKQKLEEAVEQVPAFLKFTVSAGISQPFKDVARMKKAMLEADNALMYRLYRGYGQVILFQEVSQHEAGERRLDEMPTLESIIQAIESGNGRDAEEAIAKVLESIREQNWYPSEALQFLHEATLRIYELCSDEEQAGNSAMERYETLHWKDIEFGLVELVKPLAERYGQLIESKDFVLCHRMIEYMKQRLGDPIGIPEISEEAGISSSLASQIFKQETGETIYNYLTNLRMERAAELLVKTDDRLADIAEMVGYQHENSFIRTFRKVKEITPGKYRDMMRTRMDASIE
ncbi:AraC family transcriptional regulator [Paenibacillus sp. HB172176]|uniref:AraC family transcriptional regulator n=1 Tax=Paenibacillus sp. HB172176 TaxID=2493690 RepID=UPI00143ACED4|nr:AraC family transcriptional regulator [Paenibacillus sp. HB172176]